MVMMVNRRREGSRRCGRPAVMMVSVRVQRRIRRRLKSKMREIRRGGEVAMSTNVIPPATPPITVILRGSQCNPSRARDAWCARMRSPGNCQAVRRATSHAACIAGCCSTPNSPPRLPLPSLSACSWRIGEKNGRGTKWPLWLVEGSERAEKQRSVYQHAPM